MPSSLGFVEAIWRIPAGDRARHATGRDDFRVGDVRGGRRRSLRHGFFIIENGYKSNLPRHFLLFGATARSSQAS